MKPEEQKPEAPKTLAKKEPSQSERFTEMVMKQFTDNAGELKLTNFMKKLSQNYFIKIDQTLKDLEKKRMAKKEEDRDPLAFTWANVNLTKLAIDVVSHASVGLDPTQPNQINCIPYKNTGTNKFDIGFIIGYKGLEIKVRKYGLNIPDDIIVELVYAKDEFKQFKRDMNNRIEGYTLNILDDFDRGELKGGFYYLVYKDHPERNKIRVFTKADIEKRKPQYASVEFWGGEKDNWEYDAAKGKRVKKGTIKTDGWFEEMAYKTIFRSAYNSITIDAEKIDDNYQAVMERERDIRDERISLEIKANANTGEPIAFEEEKTDEPKAELNVVNEQPATEETEAEEVTTEETTTQAPY